MDIRKTEEFQAVQRKIMEERRQEEISAMNIIKNMKRTEDFRRTLYQDSNLGNNGPLFFGVAIGAALSVFTMTKKFSFYFPNFSRFLGRSFAIRIFIVLFFARVGITIEQAKHERTEKAKDYQNYISALAYTNDLTQRRFESIDYLDRVYLLTGIDLKNYINKTKEDSQ